MFCAIAEDKLWKVGRSIPPGLGCQQHSDGLIGLLLQAKENHYFVSENSLKLGPYLVCLRITAGHEGSAKSIWLFHSIGFARAALQDTYMMCRILYGHTLHHDDSGNTENQEFHMKADTLLHIGYGRALADI